MDLKKIIVLIILCVLTSFYCWYIDNESLYDLLVFSGDSLSKGYFWVVLTALFIHSDLMHLGGNMLFLYVFGSVLENEVGSNKTIAAFFIGGALSFILSIPFYGPETVMIGASAAIFTLTAIVMLVKPLKFSWFFLMPLGLVAILYFLYNLAAAFYLEGESIGYWGHIIGFIIGLPMGIMWSKKKWMRNLIIAVALLAAYFVLILFLEALLGIV